MKLQTHIPLTGAKDKIDYSGRLLLIGSCFVEHIGEKLSYFKFRSLQNPLGILFHPLAIETMVAASVDEKRYTEKDIFYLNERWHCFDAHSDLSDVSKERLLQKLEEAQKKLKQAVAGAGHIVITLGTAWVYRHKESGKKVANCHKVPQKQFDKHLLQVPRIEESLRNIVNSVRAMNKAAQIIFTVSPVRHLKDGFVENQQSKAHLITAVHKIVDKDRIFYFPSYELMMDELRDYRFYKSDMVHPSSVAVTYIWEKFKEVWVSNDAKGTMLKVDTIQKGLAHRPFNPESEQHRLFLDSLQEKIMYIQKKYPFIEF